MLVCLRQAQLVCLRQARLSRCHEKYFHKLPIPDTGGCRAHPFPTTLQTHNHCQFQNHCHFGDTAVSETLSLTKAAASPMLPFSQTLPLHNCCNFKTAATSQQLPLHPRCHFHKCYDSITAATSQLPLHPHAAIFTSIVTP